MVQSSPRIILPGDKGAGLIKTAKGILVPEEAAPAPQRPPRHVRRALLRAIKADLRRKKRRGNKIQRRLEDIARDAKARGMAIPAFPTTPSPLALARPVLNILTPFNKEGA